MDHVHRSSSPTDHRLSGVFLCEGLDNLFGPGYPITMEDAMNTSTSTNRNNRVAAEMAADWRRREHLDTPSPANDRSFYQEAHDELMQRGVDEGDITAIVKIMKRMLWGTL